MQFLIFIAETLDGSYLDIQRLRSESGNTVNIYSPVKTMADKNEGDCRPLFLFSNIEKDTVSTIFSEVTLHFMNIYIINKSNIGTVLKWLQKVFFS